MNDSGFNGYITIPGDTYKIVIWYGMDLTHLEDDNVDVFVKFNNDDKYTATFVSVANIHTLMKNHQTSGECCHGLYLWIADMIIVQDCSAEVIQKTVEGLIADGEFYLAFSKIEKDENKKNE